jgi:glucan phosphoethanolaminetransferase (alkaline phosphatase superfamily)
MTLDVLKVPLFVWASPQLQSARPTQMKFLLQNAGRPGSARCTFHTVLDLSGIRISEFDEKLSL